MRCVGFAVCLGIVLIRTKLCTGVKNRTKSEFRKRDIELDVNLGTAKGGKAASELGVFEVSQNVVLLGAYG